MPSFFNKKMFPTIGSMLNEIYLAFISDFINDEEEKNKIAKRLERLKNEKGSLNKDLLEFISYSEMVLNNYFKEEMFSKPIILIIQDTIRNYRYMLTNEGTYLSESLSKEWFWATYYQTFKEIIKDKLDYFKSLGLFVPDDYDFFFLETKLGSTPLSKVLKWVLDTNIGSTKEELSNKLKSRNEIDTNKKKVYRWMNKWQNFNAKNFFYEVEPFLALLKFEKEKKIYLGVKFSLYFSIALTKLYHNLKKDCLSEKTIKIMANKSNLDKDAYFKCVLDSLADISTATCFLKAYSDLHETNKKIKNNFIKKTDVLSKIQEYKTSEVFKQFDFNFAYHIPSAKLAYYYDKKYKDALFHYLKIFEFGRYKLGTELKQICLEALKSARKENDRKSFKKIYYWLTFILGEEFRYSLGSVMSCKDVWDFF